MDTVFYNGTIVTMAYNDIDEENANRPEAVLVRNGIIEKCGSLESVRSAAADGAEFKDLSGACLMPGFIDSHGHITMNGKMSLCADLSDCTTLHEIAETMKRYIAENGEQMKAAVGFGYDHNFLTEQAHPDKKILDDVSTEIPVFVLHISGHIGCANSAALKAAGIGKDTPDPEGGRIGRDPDNGEPDGYLEELAMHMVQNAMIRMTEYDIRQIMTRMQEVYLKNGVTTVQDGLTAETDLALLKAANHLGMLKVDVVSYPEMSGGGQDLIKSNPELDGVYQGHLKIGGYKLILDGSPQARTAWMSRPYCGEKEYSGFPWMSDEAVNAYVRTAVAERRQILVHCNGDAASEQFLNAYEAAVAETKCTEDLRPVMIHCQTVRNDQLDRMKKLKMIASIFVGHVWYWGDVHMKNFGSERGNHISPVRDAMDRGIVVNFHQDCPITKPNMLHSIWCAVNRQSRSGAIIGKDQAINVYDALKSVTIHAAYEYSEENAKGSIEAGKRADLIIIDRSPLEAAPAEIRDLRVLETWKDGVTVYTAQ